LLLVEIEPGAGSVVESAGRDRKDLPFSCVLDILFLILVGADRPLDDIIAVILLRCGSLGHQDFVPSYDRSIECLVRERRLYIELYYLAARNILFVRAKIKSSLVFLFKIEPTLVADQDRAGCRFSGRECWEGSQRPTLSLRS
jgi:hypothetical protein